MAKITALVHTYNAERYLEEVLESLKGFDEILVCDMYSNDRTLQICDQYGCRIIYHENIGWADPARHFAIQSASNEWVFVVDADEVVPAKLRDYLYQFAETAEGKGYAGLRIPLHNYFMGRPMRASYPNYVLRFMRKSKSFWPTTVHSQPQIDGGVAVIPRKRKDLAFIHYSDPNISQMWIKQDTYSSYEPIRRKGKKYSLFGGFIRIFFRFFKTYFIKGGFRDGKAGFVYCNILASYKFLTIAKIWEADPEVTPPGPARMKE